MQIIPNSSCRSQKKENRAKQCTPQLHPKRHYRFYYQTPTPDATYLATSKTLYERIRAFEDDHSRKVWILTGGLELSLLCDMSVVEENAMIGVFCQRWGIPPIDGGWSGLQEVVGLARALGRILKRQAIGASEALAPGLVRRVMLNGKANQTSSLQDALR